MAEVKILRAGGARLAAILRQVATAVRPGVTTLELDSLARNLITAGGDEPAFLNYQPAGARQPFPAALCVSVNDEVVHGLPGGRVIVEGDIVSLDLGLRHQGLFTDMAITVPVGQVDQESARLIEITRRALLAGIGALRAGGRLGDVGAAVAAVARVEKLGLVTALGGHGVGREVHEEPLVPNIGQAGEGERVVASEVLAIEPMLTLGGGTVRLSSDGFTYLTRDGSRSAHFEHTAVVTERGSEILTV
ncbi:MAG: type I methionyl aminopeptidase [Patescibacteria group bacterium]